MKIDYYISELLFHHNCVIVPDLGGFIGNYKTASIQAIQHKFAAPSKQISFNKSLNSNDGLLANYFAKKENISYTAACAKISAYVIAIQQELAAKNNVLIEEVGSLFLDAEHRIQFNPKTTNNYLLASFGLTTFQQFPVKRERLEDKLTKEFKDRVVPLVVVGERKINTKKWLVAATITIPLAFFAIWMPSNIDLDGDLTYANLNPFVPTPRAVYSERTTPTFKENTSTETTFKAIDLKEEHQELTTVKQKTNLNPLTYHIIGGCFSDKSNAQHMVKKLQKAGFNAAVLGQRKGLWTVRYSSFPTKAAAIKELATAKTFNGKAWILNQSF